jgi:hypothetical protein
MNVSEIKAKLPEAEIYELDPDARYIILVSPAHVSDLMLMKVMIVGVPDLDNAMRILEIKPEINVQVSGVVECG